MSKLWNEKNSYTIFDPAKHSVSDTCGRIGKFLPYERNYRTLDNQELHELISDAKNNNWQALDLRSCGIKQLPDELWSLSNLRILYIGNNRSFFQNDTETNYDRNENTFPIIPKKIEQLKNLQVLSLSGKHTEFEDNNTLCLPQLFHLDIYDCNYKQIPKPLLIPSLEGIGFNCLSSSLSSDILLLKHLKYVYFSRSQFTELPEGFGNSNNLKVLFLHGSQITHLPQSLSKAVNLSRIFLDNTPLETKTPPEILKQSAKEIVRYILSQQSSANKSFFNESKMIIVGQGHVGKTSILNRVIHNMYSEESSTEGIDISSWSFKRKKEEYKLNVWDFGGQEIYHATHQFFLTKRTLYLLVWDALAEEEYGRIDYWLKTIQSFAGDSPIILVVNKCDKNIGRYSRIDENDYIVRFPQIKTILYVSCRDNTGIKELKKSIKEISINLPLMKTTWLNTWMFVRNKLEELAVSKNYITYKEYLEICKNIGVNDKKEALSLIKYLNDLGIVLYYYDDNLLKNLVILSSEWGTDAVYKILDEQERQLKDRNGILYTYDLEYIWSDNERYPSEFYPHLLNLMEKFQLAFKIDNCSYLVAELLDNKPIELGWDFSRDNSLEFRYNYDFLPAGVMTRFIVSMNKYIITIDGTKPCWKKGAYLCHKSAYALVRLFDNITERYVSIQVSGEQRRDKLELLYCIRYRIEEINSLFSQIKITKLIPCNCDKECNHLYNYDVLVEAEKRGRDKIMCDRSFKDVSIASLLDGVKINMEKSNSDFGAYIDFKPQIYNNSVNNLSSSSESDSTSRSESTASNSTTVTVEVKNNIDRMTGELNNLKSTLSDEFENVKPEFENAEKAIMDLSNCKTNAEINKSGALGRLETFIVDCKNPDTTVGKIVQGTKNAGRFLKRLAQNYNSIAKWMGLPQIPFV